MIQSSAPSTPRLALFAVGLALALPNAGCSGAEGPPNVLFVVADTLRADKLGCYGNDRGLSPRIDRFASGSALFEAATSHAPWTLPSTASLFTSLYPQQHGAGGQLSGFTSLDPAAETVAECFSRAGYATHAIVNVAFLGEKFGLTRGFDEVDIESFNSNVEVRSAEDTTDAALAWLDGRAAAPFFLFVHYFDVHAVYAPPQPWRRQFAAPPDREDESFVFGTRPHMMALRQGMLDLEDQVIRRAERLYDAEVAYMDDHIGRLLDGLDQRGLARETVVLFTTDHGEEFLDHGGFEHGHTLYAELTDVPLILRTPDRAGAGSRLAYPVGHIDVAPTLCDLAGIEPPRGAMGQSLVPLLSAEGGPEGLGTALGERPLLAHGNFWAEPLSSARVGDFKLVLPAARSGADPELFRWREDRAELQDVAAEEADVVARLQALIAEFEREMARAGPGEPVELPAELQEGLESLGYGGGNTDE